MLRVKFVLIFVLFFCKIHAKVNRGIINLQQIDLSKQIVELNGFWEFYPNTTYSDFKNNYQNNFSFCRVPGSWNEALKSNTGYALYRLNIVLNSKQTHRLGLWLRPVSNAGNVYIDGEKMTGIGTFSTNINNANPEYKSLLIGFFAKSDTIELAIEISNYHYRVGGLMYTPCIGSLENIRDVRLKQIILFSLLIGALVVIFIYFIGFYFTNRAYRVALAFAFLCLFGAIRVASTGELILKILFDIPYHWMVKLELSSLYLTVAFGLLFLDQLMQQVANKKIINILVAFHVALAAFTLTGSIPVISFIVPFYLVLLAFIMVYALYIIYCGYNKKIQGYYINAFAFLVLFALGINDILVSQYLVESTIYLMPAGIFVFVILQSFAVTKVYAHAFKKVDLLTNALRETNRNQEYVIAQRTQELNKQAEELRYSNMVKNKIFSIVAHDLRAPINSLQTVLDIATEDDITLEELKLYLAGIRKNVKSLSLTLENVLNWSKLQMENTQINPELFDALVSVQSILAFYEIMAKEKGIKLNNTIHNSVFVYADKNHFEIVLRNLLNNAIKFSNSGNEITISCEPANNDMIAFTVSDQGIGIPADKLNGIFNAAFSHTTFGTNNEKGTGLGLQLCKEYVELNKGTISITSKEGVGTSITFTLPSKAG